jgi:hypothetical protein
MFIVEGLISTNTNLAPMYKSGIFVAVQVNNGQRISSSFLILFKSIIFIYEILFLNVFKVKINNGFLL